MIRDRRGYGNNGTSHKNDLQFRQRPANSTCSDLETIAKRVIGDEMDILSRHRHAFEAGDNRCSGSRFPLLVDLKKTKGMDENGLR